MKKILVASFLLISQSLLIAQELDCDVTINTQQLTSDALENLSDFAAQVKQYMNNTRWTKEDFGNDRITCTMNIFIKGSPGTGRYVAQVFIGSRRKIWDLKTNKPTEKNSATLRILDENWEFSYTRGVPLTRNEYKFDALTSFLDFYAYVILGFDYDSYESMAGTPHFQKALDIFNLSRSSGRFKGWEFPGSGTYSRTRFINEIMNADFNAFRVALYEYHSEGLDRITKDQSTALTKMFEAVNAIGNVKKRINQPSVIIKMFFDTKYLELCDIFQTYHDEKVYEKLSAIDPSHQKSYEEWREKRIEK